MNMSPMSSRSVYKSPSGRFRGGKNAPLCATAVLGREGGVITESVILELDPVAGQVRSPITAKLWAIMVPVQAIDALKNPTDPYPGVTEVIREKLMTGNPLFGLETETEISKRLAVNPAPVAGVKKVNEMTRLAYIAANNFLRKRKYVYAVEALANSTAILPAILSETVLDRLQGVLDPDPHINGQVSLSIPTMNLPVAHNATATSEPISVKAMNQGGAQKDLFLVTTQIRTGTSTVADPDGALYAIFDGAAQGVSLVDFYNAEKQDKLTRAMRAMIDANPLDGDEQVARYVNGIKFEPGRHPFIIAEREQIFGMAVKSGTDGTSVLNDTMVSNMKVNLSYEAVIPPTELGGIIITMAAVLPDEYIPNQPDPILSQPWGIINTVADEFLLDPVPVRMRELDHTVAALSENTIAFYTGHNALKRNYTWFGFNRHVDPALLENRIVVWQYPIPASVTPENILYPADIDHYPFLDAAAEVCRYTHTCVARFTTPLVFGPTPVETVAALADGEVFGE